MAWAACADWHLSLWKVFWSQVTVGSAKNPGSGFLSEFQISIIRVNIPKPPHTEGLCLWNTVRGNWTSPWSRWELATRGSELHRCLSAKLCSLSSRRKPPGPLRRALVISQNNWGDLSSSQFSLIFKNKIGFYSWRMSVNQASSYKNVWKRHLSRDRNERLGQVILVPSVLGHCRLGPSQELSLSVASLFVPGWVLGVGLLHTCCTGLNVEWIVGIFLFIPETKKQKLEKLGDSRAVKHDLV